jgi:hypothetical protein
MVPLGSGTGVTSYTVSSGGGYSFVNYGGSQWYMVATNGADHLVDYSSVSLSAWGAPTADLSVNSHKLTNLTDGSASTDAATYGQVSAKVASVTAGDSTVTIGGTSTAPTVKVTANTFDPYGAAAAKVASVTAADSTVTIGGTSTAPTVAVAQANLTVAQSQVTNLTTALAAKAATSLTISTTAPLSGGGDLSANRTLSIADGTTSVKGAVQLTDSTSSTSTTTAATPNSVKTAYDLANAALPKSGGTMSGAIAMGSNRITGLTNNAMTDAALVSQLPMMTGINFTSYLAWTAHPDYANGAGTWSVGFLNLSAFYVPYTMTISNIQVFVSTAGSGISNAYLGVYNSTTLLGQTAAISAQWSTTGQKTHAITPQSAGSMTLTQGVYWVGILIGAATTNPGFSTAAGGGSLVTNLGQTQGSNTISAKSVVTSTGGLSALPTGSIGAMTFNSRTLMAGLY